MSKRSAYLLLASVFLGACGSTAPAPAPKSPAAPPDPPPAHQSEEKPKLPQKQATPGKGGHDSGAKKKSSLTFDLPPGWEKAAESVVPKPWNMGFFNQNLGGQILVDFKVRGPAPAAELAADIAQGICPQRKWTCSTPKPLASGDGAYFTINYGKTKGKIAVRDLDGSGRCQLQLFGLWSKENDDAATAGFDAMLSSAEVQ